MNDTTSDYEVAVPGKGYRRVTLCDGSTVDRRHGGGHSRPTYTFRDRESGKTIVRNTPALLRKAMRDAGWHEELADAVRDACHAIIRSMA